MVKIKMTENTNIKSSELESKVDFILETLQQMKDGGGKKYYTTKELSELTGIGKSVIDRLRQNGEISYSKIGQTYIFTQRDIDELMENNRIRYVG